MVSTLPQRRSKYFRAAGTKTIVPMNYHNIRISKLFSKNLLLTSKIEVSTNADVKSAQGVYKAEPGTSVR